MNGTDATNYDKDAYRKHRTGGLSNIDPQLLQKVDNSHRWPLIYCNFGMKFNGALLRSDPVPADPLSHAKNIFTFPVREDDVFLVAYPKCGTHWTSEIVSMLLKGSATYNKQDKLSYMLEDLQEHDSWKSTPSPRFFNTHLYFAHLPEGVVEKRCKIVHVVRNAKDQAVSWYHHLSRLPCSTNFSFEEFLAGYMKDDYSTFSHQFNFLRQVTEFEKANPDHPIFHIHYEDLKNNALPVLRDLAEFLGAPSSGDEFLQEVIDACSFDKLKNARVHDERDAVHYGIFRKGAVGDWKNTFTVAQSERFDEFMREQEKKGHGFTFREC